jgi:hypothetical protein
VNVAASVAETCVNRTVPPSNTVPSRRRTLRLIEIAFIVDSLPWSLSAVRGCRRWTHNRT